MTSNRISSRLKFFHLPDFSRTPVLKFIARRSGPFDGRVCLTRDRVYIVPTKAGLLFSLLLFTLLLGSINYEKSLGFLLTFLLAGIANVTLLSTWRNLAGLELKAMSTPAVFATDKVTFTVKLINHQQVQRYAIAISHLGKEYEMVDCAASSNQLIRFDSHAEKRGLLNAGKFRLYTEFPMGLFIAWTWIDLNMRCLVYPQPDNDTRLYFKNQQENGDIDLPGHSMENFSQLRKYQRGDNINRISWKAAAKNDALFTKEFNGASSQNQWINWFEIEARNDEHRLSIMTAMIINADNNHQSYGIKLPQKQIKPGQGNKHYHQCLSALALF